MKRALQSADNSSSQRPHIDRPAGAASLPVPAAAFPPKVSAGNQDRTISLLQGQFFFSAVAKSDLPGLKKLNPPIVRGLVNETDRASGLTPLMLAVKSHNPDTAGWLIQHGAKPDLPCARGTSALMYAAKRGDCVMLQLLLAAGAAIGQTDPEQRTALHHAAMQGQTETATLLLDQGAALEHQDAEGNTALLYAAARGHLPVLRLLLRNKANCHARDREGRSALHVAAAMGQHEAVAELSKQPGSEVDLPDRSGSTALHLAAIHGHHDAVRRLLDNGAEACKVDAFGSHALHKAALKGHTAVVETLISTGRNREFIDHPDRDGCTPLLLAARQGKSEVVRLLAEHGAGLLLREKSACTALQFAAASGHANVARVLLARMTPLLQVLDASWPTEVIIKEALREAITVGNAGVVEVFLRSQPHLASLPFEWQAHPVIADLRDNVHMLIGPPQGNNDQPGRFPVRDDCMTNFGSLLELTAATHDDGATLGLHWQASMGSCAVIAEKLRQAALGIDALQRTLAGSQSQAWRRQTTLVAAGILASLGEPSVFNAPYAGKGLSPEAETCLNTLALDQAHVLAQAGEDAEQGLVNALGNLHGTCMASFAGKPFHQVNLYLYLTRKCGLYDMPAKRISDAFAETWAQHKQSGATARERALAQALADRSRRREVLEAIAHDSALSGNEATFHWLLNRQLDLVNAWHRKVLETAVQ